jgi:hypothetical protein
MQERFIQGGPADGDVFCRDVLVLQRADDMGQGGEAIGDRHAESPGVMIEAHISAELNLQEPGRGNQVACFAQHDIDPVAAGQRLQFVRAAGRDDMAGGDN